ncbi:MAG TPA: hypothetical protein VLB09_09480 [Nitrospiria bacterium]|nr:hypothetical protein [Nitrospiria bacterium]
MIPLLYQLSYAALKRPLKKVIYFVLGSAGILTYGLVRSGSLEPAASYMSLFERPYEFILKSNSSKLQKSNS